MAIVMYWQKLRVAKVKCQILEWHKQSRQKLEWQKQSFPLGKVDTLETYQLPQA